jgi:SAM-dependent methyltransferase
MGLYDRYILPPLIDLACGARPIGKQRAKLVPSAAGVVLELGFGSGRNLPYYDRAKVERLYALEPSPGMLVRARKLAAGADLPVEILPETAETLSLGAASVDTVVVTYSLCTIPDPAAALEAARRALKPDGRLLFCEHGRAPDAEVRRAQARIEPIWKRIAGGCHLTRDIPALIQGAGFRIETLETMYLPATPGWAGFNSWGVAGAT